jgi:hypothetical protein
MRWRGQPVAAILGGVPTPSKLRGRETTTSKYMGE